MASRLELPQVNRDPGDTLNLAKEIINQYSPIVARLLGVPARKVKVSGEFNPQGRMPPGMVTAGYYDPDTNTIHVSPQNDDPNTLIHELVHAYTLTGHGPHFAAATPGAKEETQKWLVEGIADWAKDKILGTNPIGRASLLTRNPELIVGNREVASRSGTPYQGYQPAAEVIQYLDREHPGGAQWLAKHLANGTYSDKAFTQEFGMAPQAMFTAARPHAKGHPTEEGIIQAQNSGATDQGDPWASAPPEWQQAASSLEEAMKNLYTNTQPYEGNNPNQIQTGENLRLTRAFSESLQNPGEPTDMALQMPYTQGRQDPQFLHDVAVVGAAVHAIQQIHGAPGKGGPAPAKKGPGGETKRPAPSKSGRPEKM